MPDESQVSQRQALMLAKPITGMSLSQWVIRRREVAENPAAREAFLTESIDVFWLSTRSRRLLGEAGIQTVGELISWTEEALLNLRGWGRQSLNEVSGQLVSYGLTLGGIDKKKEDRNG